MSESVKLLTAQEVSEILQVKPFTLYMWRSAGKGPKYAKIGRKILYTTQALNDFINSKTKEEMKKHEAH